MRPRSYIDRMQFSRVVATLRIRPINNKMSRMITRGPSRRWGHNPSFGCVARPACYQEQQNQNDHENSGHINVSTFRKWFCRLPPSEMCAACLIATLFRVSFLLRRRRCRHCRSTFTSPAGVLTSMTRSFRSQPVKCNVAQQHTRKYKQSQVTVCFEHGDSLPQWSIQSQQPRVARRAPDDVDTRNSARPAENGYALPSAGRKANPMPNVCCKHGEITRLRVPIPRESQQ